ncbi:MAG TPA: hypothetical protein VHY37_00355 [Tepidisphaeraceae bacterium]|jgi:hypothetical protein|nr:hypothetical protein [Tepidisphaeraceae bacterium]
MITGILLLAALLLVLMVLGLVQAVRFLILLFSGRARRREEEQMGAMRTALDLRRMRQGGYITPEVYEQVAQAHALWRDQVAPQATVPLATRLADAPTGNRAIGEVDEPVLEMPTAAVSIPLSPISPPPLPVPTGTRRPAPPPKAERSALLASFLEHRNIRWGELVGGLLILGCSTALVVSFWAQIAERPIFKFALFTFATAAFFGVGLYSEHRWKLPITSRAILLLATLLVPVNLLAVAALGGSGKVGSSPIIAQLASLAIFTALAWPAARVLIGEFASLLTAGLAATCLTLIAITAHPVVQGGLATLGAMPVGCLLICSAVSVGQLWKNRSIGWPEAASVYLLHGVIGFAGWLAVGFLLFSAPQLDTAVAALSPIFTAMALPALFLGLAIWKRGASGEQRTAISGLAVAIFGTAILLAGLLAAWPGTERLTAIGAFDAVLLGAAAIVFDLPAAYVPAAILAALAWLVGVHTWPHPTNSDSQSIVSALQAGNNGWLLLPMAIVLGIGGRAAARRPSHGLILGVLALFAAAASIALANFAVLAHAMDTELDPACFDLLVGAGFLVLWAGARRRRWWDMLGTVIPLLLAELFIARWNGWTTDGLIQRILPSMPIALCTIVPMAVALIGWRGKRGISPGVLAGAGLLETLAIALAYRWNRPGDVADALLILRTGHVILAWAVFGLGAWLRRRVEVPIAEESAESEAVAPAGRVLSYRTQGLHRRWRLLSLRAEGIVEQTVRWVILTGLLAFIGCMITDGRLISGAAGMLALSILAGCLACWADLPGMLFVAGALLNFAGTFALLSPPVNRLVKFGQLPTANVVFLAIGGGAALLLDRQVFGRRARFHFWASWASLLLLAVIWTLQSLGSLGASGRPDWAMWTALGSIAALFAARVSEPRARDPIAGMYLAGILGVAFGLAYVPREWIDPQVPWGMALGLYGLVTAAAGLAVARLLNREDPRRRFMVDWLRICTAVLAALAMCGAAYGDWKEPGQRVRIAAAGVAFAQGIALGLLAEDEAAMQAGALAATAAGMVLIAWAMMPAVYLAQWLVVISGATGTLAAFAVAADGASRAVGKRWRRPIDSVVTVAVGAIAIGAAVVVIGESSAQVLAPALTSASLGLIRIAQLPSLNVIFLVIAGGAGFLLDRKGRRGVMVGVWTSWTALLLLAAIWAVQSSGMVMVRREPDWLMWTALGAVAAMFADRLDQPTARDPIAGIYLTGLLGLGYSMAYVPATWAAQPVAWSIALGAYGVVAAAIGAGMARAMPKTHRRRKFLVDWLRITSAVVAMCALCGAMYCDWNNPGWRVRMLAAVAACAQGIGLALVAEEDVKTESAALTAAAAGMVAIAWAAMPIGHMARWLDVASAAVVALSAFAAGSAGARKCVGEPWRSTIRSILKVVVCAAVGGMVAVVVGEATDLAMGAVPLISPWAVIGIECGLLIALAAAIAAAFGTTAAPAERSACTWAAEGLALLAFVHLRVTEPWLFSHRFEQYWPMVVMALAFAAISGGFALNRRGRGEIGRPLVYTGVALPAAAIFGYWLHPSIVDYSAVLWTAGLLYGIVAAIRRSPGVTLLSAACVNAALWVVWGRYPQTQFFAHPQLWIVPAALSVLASAQIHHRQLNTVQMRSIRYLCLAVIYLSSMADIVLNGVTAAPWLPMVMAGLAIVGVLAGITWRIRPFLYLGTTFLLIAVLTMIWTAQQNLHWTWLWYVAGLVAGVALFALFGLFEKRREQMARVFDGLKQWQ